MASVLLALWLAASLPDAPVAPTVAAPVAPIAAVGSHPAPAPPPAPAAATAASAEPKKPQRPGLVEAPGAPYSRPPAPLERGKPPEPLLDLSSAPRGAEPSVTPPALTASALRDELASSARRRQEELAGLERERARLERLATEIAAARAALHDETERLDHHARKGEADRAEAGGKAAPPRPAARPPPRPGEKPLPTGAEAIAKTLKGMKVEPAAALLARLDRPLAVDVLRHMRPADAGAVLERLKPETAADLVSAMASDGAAGGAP